MAGGRSNKPSGSLDRTHQWLYSHQLYTSVIPKPHLSETFKKHQYMENSRIVKKSITDLQNSVFRLLYTNLDFAQEEQLVVELILNITNKSNQINSVNVNEVSSVNERCEDCSVSSHKRATDLEEHIGNVRKYAASDASPTLSDMADSGLETGSVSPHENTTSENSSTDFEELHGGDYTSTSDDLDKIRGKRPRDIIEREPKLITHTDRYGSEVNYISATRVRDLVESAFTDCASNDHSATCSSTDAEQAHLDSSSSSTENQQKGKLNGDEILQYESRVLSDAFYESDCVSDENESFEFIDLSNTTLANTRKDKQASEKEIVKIKDEDKEEASNTQTTNSKSQNVTNTKLELPHTSVPKQKSSCNTTNYYFIDASTLNDEIEVPATNSNKSEQRFKNSQPHLSFKSDLPDSKSNNFTEEQCYKYTTLKTTNLQSGHERIAEFERELKLTKYLEPTNEARKVMKTDSTSEEKAELELNTNKESLAVEIKEADSGESAHPSPCPDNNINSNNDQTNSSPPSNETHTAIQDVERVKPVNELSESEKDVNPSEDNQKPPLIRRSTFELSSNDDNSPAVRQEYERRQGNLVFQNAIPQYSGHRVDGDSCFNILDDTSVPRKDVHNNYPADLQLSSSTQYHAMPYLSLDDTKYEAPPSEAENSNLVQTSCKSATIHPMVKSAGDKFDSDTFPNLDDNSNNCSSSLPVNLECILEKESKTDTLKRIKCDESMPIISGGVSTIDYSKPTDSPTVRRKTESTPIVSGGSVIMNQPEIIIKPSRMSSSMTAWIVDMSDCNKNDSKSSSSSMSHSFSSSEYCKKPMKKLSSHEKHGSLGFFVNLKDMDCSKSTSQPSSLPPERKETSESSRSYCEFYVDMSNTNNPSKKEKTENVDTVSKHETSNERGDKKNIFSMFIDLNDPHKVAPDARPSHRRSLSTFSERRIDSKSDDANSNDDSTTTKEDSSSSDQKCTREKTKPSVFMFIESDSPVVRRRTLSSSRPAFKRHSWNVDKTQGVNSNGHVVKDLLFKKEHKRAHSLSVDRGDVKKCQAKPSSSSQSLSDAAKAEPYNQKNSKLLQEGGSGAVSNMDTSSEEVFEFDVVRDTPPNSHVEVINEELRVSVKKHEYKELRSDETTPNVETTDAKGYEDEFSETSAWEKTCTESTEGPTRKSETFDISSGSGPSPGSDNHDYELSELLNGDAPNIEETTAVSHTGSKISETHKSLNETIKKIECEFKGPEYVKSEEPYEANTSDTKKVEKSNLKELYLESPKATCSNFVRLSDLDKTPIAAQPTDLLTVTEDRSTYRMCSSIPETSWIESKLVMTRTNGSIRPLPRKLTSVMSTSLPPKQKSPMEDLTGEYDGEGIISESDLSSMQSSMGRSGAEGSTEETETSSLAGVRPYNRLGEDLLRMFLEEINPDVAIDVAGRRIKAHKCILSSRCQYFAAILSGGWIESAGNVISLQGYSYDAVHFALCHIYSGESNIPESISIVELATLADMLCLEGLKEVIGYTLKVKYCHLFHKPCQICAVGVLECMPLAAAYGLDEVYRKSLRWVTRHFVRIWPCKAFATLPRELMEKCYHQHIVHMSTDNVLQTMMDCDKLLATLPNVRWAEPVFRMVSNLLETSAKFLSDNFSGVLGNENFQSLGRELTWNISRLEDNFLAAAERLPPDQACKSYSKLHKMLASAQMDESQEKLKWGPLFVEFLNKIQSRVEKCLVRDAARAARTTTWLKMDLELRRRIQELACLVILPYEATKRQSRHSSYLKEPRAPANVSTTSRTVFLERVKMAITEHNGKTMKQMSSAPQVKKTVQKPKSDPMERKVQDEKLNADIIRLKSWSNKMEVKCRYLEPRNKPVPKEPTQPLSQEKIIPQQRRKIMISSSDSSRTSSPAMKRAMDKKPLAKIKLPVKKDVKALSSDSLTEPNVSRPNNKKDPTSKSCGITRPESPSFKQKGTEIGLSVDSLAESKNKPTTVKKKPNKMDTSMSTDSLMTEITTTPKSNTSNKLSPTLRKAVNKTQAYDRTKKSSPPMQQRSPLTVTKRPTRSLESSTAASRSRAAAISAYHGSPSLRKSLLDAAKTPDVPNKPLSNMVTRKTIKTRPLSQSATSHANTKKEKKDGTPNQQSSESPSKRSSPKSSGTNRTNKITANTTKKTVSKAGSDEKFKTKCHNGDTPKQLTVGSRSGTFLKDEPTILKKKTDIKTSQINT